MTTKGTLSAHISCAFAVNVRVAKCIDDDDWESCAPLIRGLPAAHNERDRKTTASVTSLPETSRVVLQSCPAQNALLQRIRMCRVRFVSKDVHSTTRVDVEVVKSRSPMGEMARSQ